MIRLTRRSKFLVGMVHAQALPGAPRNKLTVAEICRLAADEASQLEAAGFDAVLVENMHDVPYLKRSVGPEIIAAMAVVTQEVRRTVKCPVGVQILAGANKASLAVALATGGSFIRAEGMYFAHVADEGFFESDAGEALRFRRAIGAQHILILADIKKKHSSHAITADVSLRDTASAAEFFGADGIVVSGKATADPASLDDLEEARRGSQLPLIVGSGTTPEILRQLWHKADGVIVGSFLKRNGRWSEPLDPARVRVFMQTVQELRRTIPEEGQSEPTEVY